MTSPKKGGEEKDGLQASLLNNKASVSSSSSGTEKGVASSTLAVEGNSGNSNSNNVSNNSWSAEKHPLQQRKFVLNNNPDVVRVQSPRGGGGGGTINSSSSGGGGDKVASSSSSSQPLNTQSQHRNSSSSSPLSSPPPQQLLSAAATTTHSSSKDALKSSQRFSLNPFEKFIKYRRVPCKFLLNLIIFTLLCVNIMVFQLPRAVADHQHKKELQRIFLPDDYSEPDASFYLSHYLPTYQLITLSEVEEFVQKTVHAYYSLAQQSPGLSYLFALDLSKYYYRNEEDASSPFFPLGNNGGGGGGGDEDELDWLTQMLGQIINPEDLVLYSNGNRNSSTSTLIIVAPPIMTVNMYPVNLRFDPDMVGGSSRDISGSGSGGGGGDDTRSSVEKLILVLTEAAPLGIFHAKFSSSPKNSSASGDTTSVREQILCAPRYESISGDWFSPCIHDTKRGLMHLRDRIESVTITMKVRSVRTRDPTTGNAAVYHWHIQQHYDFSTQNHVTVTVAVRGNLKQTISSFTSGVIIALVLIGFSIWDLILRVRIITRFRKWKREHGYLFDEEQKKQKLKMKKEERLLKKRRRTTAGQFGVVGGATASSPPLSPTSQALLRQSSSMVATIGNDLSVGLLSEEDVGVGAGGGNGTELVTMQTLHPHPPPPLDSESDDEEEEDDEEDDDEEEDERVVAASPSQLPLHPQHPSGSFAASPLDPKQPTANFFEKKRDVPSLDDTSATLEQRPQPASTATTTRTSSSFSPAKKPAVTGAVSASGTVPASPGASPHHHPPPPPPKEHKEKRRINRYTMGWRWVVWALVADSLSIIATIMNLAEGLTVNESLTFVVWRNMILGVAAMCSCILFISYFRHVPKFYFLMEAMYAALPHLGLFMVNVTPIFFGFSIFGLVAFGWYAPMFSNWGYSFVTLIALMGGDSPLWVFQSVSASDWWVLKFTGRVYVAVFLSLFIYCALNITLAIVQNSYYRIKKKLRILQDYAKDLQRRHEELQRKIREFEMKQQGQQQQQQQRIGSGGIGSMATSSSSAVAPAANNAAAATVVAINPAASSNRIGAASSTTATEGGDGPQHGSTGATEEDASSSPFFIPRDDDDLGTQEAVKMAQLAKMVQQEEERAAALQKGSSSKDDDDGSDGDKMMSDNGSRSTTTTTATATKENIQRGIQQLMVLLQSMPDDDDDDE